MRAPLKFEQFLVTELVITQETFDAASLEAKKRLVPLSQYLLDNKILSEEKLAQALARFHGIPFVAGPLPVVAPLIAEIPIFILRRHRILPLSKTDKTVTVATNNPTNFLATEEIHRHTARVVHLVVATESAIKDALFRAGRADGTIEPTPVLPPTDSAAEAPESSSEAALHIEQIMEKALSQRASDIHLEPQANGALIRIRVDGMLYEIERMSAEGFSQMIARLKYLGGLDIVEKRLSQDGRFKFSKGTHECEVRVSTLPIIHGEKMVLRLLQSGKNKAVLQVADIGAERLAWLAKMSDLSEGLILVAGPTGSGKTSTIYSMLSKLDRRSLNLITVEDPVEYELDLANQIQVNTKIGITFASTLPNILRQDPDIIVVGELRDEETAQMCLRAAISGHLVFSTIHAPNSIQTITRLVDMNIAPYLIVAALKGCISQRLLRKLCPACKKAVPATSAQKKMMHLPEDRDVSICEPGGCEKCHNIGYHDRLVVMEMLQITPQLREAIVDRERQRLESVARSEGFRSFYDHGVERVLAGETSFQEFISNCS